MTSQWLRVESTYGLIAAEFNPAATGQDARGRRTSGALLQVWLPGTADPRLRQSRSLLPQTQHVREAFEAWLSGTGTALDAIGVEYRGSEFQQRVLREMRRIRAGEVASYGELAEAAGHPNSARAVGTVCSTNRVPLVIPCHRVLRAGGQLGQYAGQPELKRALLQLEGWSGAADAR